MVNTAENATEWAGLCANCGDEWEEREQPVICPECHSLDVQVRVIKW